MLIRDDRLTDRKLTFLLNEIVIVYFCYFIVVGTVNKTSSKLHRTCAAVQNGILSDNVTKCALNIFILNYVRRTFVRLFLYLWTRC